MSVFEGVVLDVVLEEELEEAGLVVLLFRLT